MRKNHTAGRRVATTQVKESHKRKSISLPPKTMIIAVAAVVVIAVLCILLPRLFGNKANAVLAGAWSYQDSAEYSFDGKRHGMLKTEGMELKYTYKVSGDTLKLNFKDKIATDATYTFKIVTDTLILEGGEGTTGGSYQLDRVK